MKLHSLTVVASLVAGTAANYNPPDVRDAHVKRSGAHLTLAGKPWKPVGGNAYWLGLDENVIPPKGQPFYAPFNASYPTKERVSEAMAMIKALGGTMLRTHTLGVSLGNPLSERPGERQVNKDAFDAIDWAVYQARQYGVRLMVPLIDHYVSPPLRIHTSIKININPMRITFICPTRNARLEKEINSLTGPRITIMVESTTSSAGTDIT